MNSLNMNIPFVDLKSQYQSIKEDVNAAMRDVIENTRFIGGKEVKEFEAAFAQYCNAKYCVGLNSGTDALILGFRSLHLQAGDEIIVPANTFFASVLGIVENGLQPVFVDMDKDDYGIDLNDLKRKITSKTKAVLVVHLYGHPDKLNEIQTIISQQNHHIHLIEDACQAHGAKYDTQRVGTFGTFASFSFYPGKNLGAYGDAGAIITNDEGLANECRMLREYGSPKKYYHDMIGVNSRLDTLQAAVLNVKLPHLDTWNAARQKNAALYTQLLQEQVPQVTTPKVFSGRQSVYHLYVIEVDKRDELINFLNEEGVQALIHYPIPLHEQKAFAHMGYRPSDFPHASESATHIVSLPMFPELSEEQIQYVVAKIKEFYSK